MPRLPLILHRIHDFSHIAHVNRNAIPGSSNIFNITTGNCGANSCVIESHNEIWTITSLDDGTDKDVGEINAVQIYGSNNVLNVSITDSRLVPIVRGVAFESTAQNNNLSAYQYSGVVSIYQDAGTNNVWQGDNIFHWSAPSFASGWGNAFGSPYTAAGYIRDPFGVVRLKGVVSGGTGVIFTLPTGYRPKDTLVVPAGESNVEIAANGEVFATAKSGVTRWVLGGVAFNTRSSLT